jgi:hypothetical protein
VLLLLLLLQGPMVAVTTSHRACGHGCQVLQPSN